MTLANHFKSFRKPEAKRARLIIAAEFVRQEAKARSECHDSDSACLLGTAADLLEEQIRLTLPGRYRLRKA